MYLKSLTLKGFKSFADRTVMKFEPGVAAIVGPNGSGKSNISDAVLWVLGERNAKNLRGQSMEDVIFAGSSARKPVSVAEVELCLDNSDGTLPVDFTEVSVGRRMYRNGESEYLINGAVVRRMDVLDILHDSGLGTGTNSIISQGNLDSVLSSKPEDRRALIEEAAGILKHKERKRRSARKLERMDNNLARIQDIAREVERQLKPLERKAKRAQAYQELSVQLTDVRLRLAVDDLRRLQRQWDEVVEREAVLSEQVQGAKERLDASQARLDELQRQLDTRDSAQNSLNRDYRRALNAQERLNSQIMLVREKRNHALSDLERIARERQENEQRQAAAQAELSQAKERLSDAQREHAAAKASLDATTREHNERRMERNGLRKRIDTLTTEQRGIVHRLETVQAAQAALRDEVSEAQARSRVLATQVADAELRLGAAEKEAAAAAERAEASAARLEEVRSLEAQARSGMNALVVERNASRKACDDARSAFNQRSAERHAAEELERAASRTNPALSWLLDQAEDVGDLSHLSHSIVAPSHLEPLVEALLGADLHALVVHDALDATLDALLGAQVDGQAVLVPADAAKASAASSEGISLISQLEVDPVQEGAVAALLGDVRLVDTYRQAMAGAREQGVRFASNDGCIAWPNGKVAFHHASVLEREQGTLARHRALVDLRAQEEAAKQAYERLIGEDRRLESELQALQSQTLRLSEELAAIKGQSQADANDAARTRTIAAGLSRELEALRSQQANNERSLEGARPRTDSLAAEAVELSVSLDKNKASITELEERVSPLQREVVTLSQKLSDARLDVARLDERLAYAQRMVQTRESEVAQLVRIGTEAEGRIGTANLVASRVDPLLATLGRLADAAGLLALRLEVRTQEEQARSQGLNAELSAATQAMREAHDAFDSVTALVAEARIGKGRLEVQVETAIKVITEEHGTSVETALALDPLEERDAAEAEAGSLERRIKNLGTINPDAAQEYEQIKQRHEFLSGQLGDMRAARLALKRITGVIDDRMREDFVSTFNQVNDNFAEIFATLFPGGQAHLSLVDPDDLEGTGVDVNAQPVGKRVKKMSLLSGGEKSMTAMALLFAVYRIRQTPFYILDEVEAALDDTNLRRLIGYLQTIRNETQFIMITHQRRTMESADILYGVSMQADGVTKVLSQKLEAAKAGTKEN